MHRVHVIGGGTMGRGIAQTIAAAGIPVALQDMDGVLNAKALAAIEASVQRAVAKGRMSEADRETVLRNLTTAEDFEGVENADLVIEAVFEDLGVKQAIFRRLGERCAPDALLATNTSALSVSEIASAATCPERVLGIHFFNPAPAMKLVEVIRGAETSDEAMARARAFVERIGKTSVEAREAPGFIVNRLLIPMINEAIVALADSVASAEDIDTAMKLGCGHPVGPLELADRIGLDVVASILEILEQGLGDTRYRPAPLLLKMIEEGRLGRKTGSGFYTY